MNFTLPAADFKEMLNAAKLAMVSAAELNKLAKNASTSAATIYSTMLGSVRLTVTGDGRHLEAETHDRHTRLTQLIPLSETGFPGSVCIAFADLTSARPDRKTSVRFDHAPDLLRFSPNAPTTQLRHVRGGHDTVAEITPLSADDWPWQGERLPGPEDYGCMLPPSTVSAIIDSLPFQSRDQTRYVLNGVYLDPQTSHAVATDGRRLIRFRTKTTPYPCILPTSLCSIIAALKPTAATACVREPDEPGRCSTSISLKFGRYTVHAPLVDGYYPNHKAVIPSESKGSVTFADPDGIAAWLATLKPTACEGAVRITPRAPHHVEFTHANGRITAIAHLEGEPSSIAFNPALLADCLSTLGGTLFLIDEHSPATFRKGDGLAVLMPVRLDRAPAPADAAANENAA